MDSFKKTLFVGFIIGSSSIFAGTMGPVCVDGNVSIPCQSTGFSFAGEALYLKPSYSGEFVWLEKFENSILTMPDIENTLKTNWNWGFKLDASYKFDTGNDIDLNWDNYKASNTGVATSAYNVPLPPDFILTYDIVNTYYSVSNRWSAVNLEFGQLINFNKVKNIRLHAGIEYAQMKVGINSTIVDNALGITLQRNTYSKYEGFGIRIGSDLSYGLANWLPWSKILGGISVYGSGAASLLGGNQSFSDYNFVAIDYTVGSRFNVVPEIELKLGTKFDYAVGQGSLGLNIGYMFINYFNAIRTDTPSSESNYALNGIYFGAKWTGNFI